MYAAYTLYTTHTSNVNDVYKSSARTYAEEKMAAKKSYHHGQLQEALLESAEASLEQHGPSGLSLRKLGRELGVTPGAPYRHFADKEALLGALGARGFDRLREMMLEQMRGEDDPAERLRLAGIAYLSFASAHPQLFRLMFGWMPTQDCEAVHEAGAQAFGVLQATLDAAEAADQLRLSAHDAALVVWSAIHGAAFLLIDGGLAKFELEGNVVALGNRIHADLWTGIGK